MRPAPEGATLCVGTYHAHQLVCDLGEVNLLANPGRGVTVVKLDGEDDRVVGFTVDEPLVVESEKGKEGRIEPLKKNRVTRGLKGELIKPFTRKDRVAKVVPPPVTVPALAAPAGASSPDGAKS